MSFSLSRAPRERNNPDSYRTAGTVFRRPPPLFERHPLAGGGMSPSTQSLLFFYAQQLIIRQSFTPVRVFLLVHPNIWNMLIVRELVGMARRGRGCDASGGTQIFFNISG